MSRKDSALAAVVTAAERATAADVTWGGGTPHSAVGRQDVATAIEQARNAGATDGEIRSAVESKAFRKN